MLWPRYDVFLSYSRADSERVRPLGDELCRLCYLVFLDARTIEPSEKWKDSLERSVRDARTLVLCWSEHAQGRDYIVFEYSRAQALHKRIYPWLLDRTPLPAMMEIQGIKEPDPAKVAAILHTHLGWTVPRRRLLRLILAAAMAMILAFGIWLAVQPPKPWPFQGEVYDTETQMPIAGVQVVVNGSHGEEQALTDAQGRFVLPLPNPPPKTVSILIRKEGYTAVPVLNVPTDAPFKTDMMKQN